MFESMVSEIVVTHAKEAQLLSTCKGGGGGGFVGCSTPSHPQSWNSVPFEAHLAPSLSAFRTLKLFQQAFLSVLAPPRGFFNGGRVGFIV